MTSTARENPPPTRIVGWDIGGVNTKVARLAGGVVLAVVNRPFEVRRDPQGLVEVIRGLAREVGAEPGDVHAVTMTAELARVFVTKREGVSAVLDAVEAALPGAEVRVYGTDDRFRSPNEARREPLAVASANWMATATLVAQSHPDAVLVDMGTTTTDVIPIVGGTVVAVGRTDPDRLATEELVYTGALRTPVEAVAHNVPVRGVPTALAAEAFALTGDAYLWLGRLAPDDYTTPTPDGRPATRACAGDRLCRAACADAEMLDETEVGEIALAVFRAQTVQVMGAINRVCRGTGIRTAVVTGLGAFVAANAARAAGLHVASLSDEYGTDAARYAPAVCVALRLVQQLGAPAIPVSASGDVHLVDRAPRRAVDVVVKVGGGLLAHQGALDAVLAELSAAAVHCGVLVVPGGGPFADAVRTVDRHVGLTDEAAHWMAVLAMDQYAHLLASRAADATLITRVSDLRVPDGRRFNTRRVARPSGLFVMAPYSWLRAEDPLPHSWAVTSDSIAAWVAGQVGSQRLVLVKAPGSAGDASDLVDPYFATALPREVDCRIVPADDLARLRAALS